MLAATLAVGVLAASAAEAKPPRSFYGVVPQTQLSGEDYVRMGQARVGMLRIPILWSAIDPTAVPLDYEWTELDKLVGGAAQNRVKVLPTLTSTPNWVSQLDECPTNCTEQPPQGDLALLAWRSFLRAMVQRYGPDGVYWTEHPEVPKTPITAWQIWNEQNSYQYFAPEPNSDVYAKLVTEASRAIKLEDPQAEVILGGMFATPEGDRDPLTNSWTYLRRLYAIPGFASRFEGVAIHPYSQGMSGIRAQVKIIRAEMESAGDLATDVWVTEIGWGSRSKSKEIPLNRGPKGQAKKLGQAFEYFTKKRKKLNLRMVSWFSWKDYPPELPPLCIWCPTAGLFSPTLAPKPAFSQFVKFTGGK